MKTLIVIPAYNESKRLPGFLTQLNSFNSDGKLGNVTIKVVDDGSSIDEVNLLKKAVLATKVNKYTELKFKESSPNKGKGAVLREAFLKGLSEDFDVLGFLDADGSTSFNDMESLLNYLSVNKNVDVVIGSRWKCLGKHIERSLKRHLSGRIFATLVSNIFDIPVYDSQCGAKLFRTKILSKKTLKFCDSNKWLFDTQLLILLYEKGIKIHEYPINWADKADSKVSLIKDSFKMFYGLVKYKSKLNNERV